MSVPNYPLGQGLRPYILPHLRDIVGGGALPQTKIEHVGFLNFLQSQNKPQVLRLDTAGGHQKAVQVKYLQRYTEDYAGTDEGAVCNNTNFDAYKEATANLTSFRFMAIHLEDELLAQYEEEATAAISAGTPPGPFMREMMERLMTAANAVLGGVRTDLLTTLTSSGIGVNRVTGNNNATTVNFPLNTTNNPLNASINQILSDFAVNLMSGMPEIIAGPGSLMHQFLLQQYAKSPDQSGIDTRIQAAGVRGFIDSKINTLLGANNFLAIERNTVQIVEYLQYRGFKAGWKPGASMFGTIPLPIQVGNDILPVEFDYQLRYNDCDQTLTDAYYGTPMTYKKGYNIILSKKSGIFQVPSDAYRAIDPNVSVNGVLRYNATNV